MLVKNKKLLLLIAGVTALNFTACAKNKSAAVNSNEKTIEEIKVNPQIEKLNAVLALVLVISTMLQDTTFQIALKT